ncbi:MAG: Coenzyme F420 hydrogenase/dehydrogenase, beta subunit C-terminal domain [Clostridia bacterium]|nr:Coenzyme F420 hydrogenase/dehydrogenase, beta subunit C-terminal domain [Clostridia bacterium]
MLKIEALKQECTGCSACKTVCPTGSITMMLDSEGFYFPNVDSSKCVKCGKCETVCHCLNPLSVTVDNTSYYGWHKDEEKRKNSSSGGAFAALADKIISDGGVVFGATFDLDKRELVHKSSDEAPLQEMQKSKYVESNIGDTFVKVQENLDKGRKVLFCGTPCMAAGLRRTVKDPDKNLLICDFVCHGVPSAGLFKSHLDAIFGEKDKLLELDFRPKEKCGWTGKTIYARTKNKKWLRPYVYDSFYFGFMKKNIILRRSCYDCKYRKSHISDITLADFWGYRELDPKINDEKGISLIIANNDLGKTAIENISEEFNFKRIDNKYSEYIYAPKDYSEAYGKREEFFELVEKFGFEVAAQKTYMQKSVIKFLKYKIKQAIKKVIGRR